MMKVGIGCVMAAAFASAAYAANTMPAAPTESWTITNYHKQNVLIRRIQDRDG